MWGHLRKGDVVLDLGANLGYLSLLAATKVGPEGRVIAVEAEPGVFGMLEHNLELNPLLPVVAHHAIVGEGEGVSTIHRADDDHGSSSTERTGAASGPSAEVRMVRAETLIPAEDLPSLKLIKVDVEGDELRVLHGLDDLLHRMVPGAAVLAEIAPEMLAKRGHTAEDVLRFMAERSFEPQLIPNDYSPRRYVSPDVGAPTPLTEVPLTAVDVVFTKRAEMSPGPAGPSC